MAAADEAGMPVGAWVEQALAKALDTDAQPAQPEGVELDELEAMVRRVVVEELRPVRDTLERLEARAIVPNPAGRGSVPPLRERVRRRPGALGRLPTGGE